LAYVQHDLAIAGFLLRLKSICIKHSILNTMRSCLFGNEYVNERGNPYNSKSIREWVAY